MIRNYLENQNFNIIYNQIRIFNVFYYLLVFDKIILSMFL